MSNSLTSTIPFQNSVETYLRAKLNPFQQEHIEKFVDLVEQKIKNIFAGWWEAIQAEAAKDKFSYQFTDVKYYDDEGTQLVSKLFLQTYGIYTMIKPISYSGNYKENDLLPLFNKTLEADRAISFEWHPFNPLLYPHKVLPCKDKYQLDPGQQNKGYWVSA